MLFVHRDHDLLLAKLFFYYLQELLAQVAANPGQPITIPTESVTESTTRRPRRPTQPFREPRPLLDGLAWLWRTWQETAPKAPPGRVNTVASPSYSQLINSGRLQTQTAASVPEASLDDEVILWHEPL